MTSQEQKTKKPIITVREGIYAAIVGALGNILCLVAIPVAPNVAINLYVFSGILVASTNGWLLGLIAGLISALYTPILWGWFGAFIYIALQSAFTGFLATRIGFRPIIAALIAWILQLPYQVWAQYIWLGMPMPIIYVSFISCSLQVLVAAIIVEILMGIPALRKRFPKSEIRAVGWVARSRILRHPWVGSG